MNIENTGFVYILTNDAMPGVVKIGRTSRDVEVRAGELWQTGVPVPFQVYDSQKSCDCVQLEAYMHGELRPYRVHRSREFFRIDPEIARRKLQLWSEAQAQELLARFFSGVVAVSYRHWVPSQEIERLGNEIDEADKTISEAMALLTAEEILPAVRRAKAIHRENEKEALRELDWTEDEIAFHFGEAQ